MNKTHLIAVALTAVLALAGCGGGQSDAAKSNTGNAESSGPTAAELATQLGCTGDDGTATNKASCEFQDSYLGITSYRSKSSRDADVNAVPGVKVLVGDLWMIDAPDAATLEAAQAVVGGDIK